MTAKDDKKPAKLTIKKDVVKDLKVRPGKATDVKGGGGRTKPSQPATPSDLGCTPCA